MNRQVPNQKYTIVGDGKVALHIKHYFNLTGICFNQWHHSQSLLQLQQSVAQSDVVLILIPDDVIESFIQNHAFLQERKLVHFSGTLNLERIISCHPLMTFSHELYELNTYQSMPFVCDESIDFDALFPQLNNKSYTLNKKDKAYYHAMCVMAGNFSQLLMRETAKQLNSKCDLPIDIMFPYLLQNTKNLIAYPENSATGPLERGDFSTISKHIMALQNDELKGIYKSFLKFSNCDDEQVSHRSTKSHSKPQLIRKA